MMGAKHWSERDYYRATRDAYRAWQRSWEQLVLGLEGADAGTTSLVASAPSSPPSPHADAARTSGSHSSGRGEGGLEPRYWDVSLIVEGPQEISLTVEARNSEQARRIAKDEHPNSHIVHITPTTREK